MDFDRIDLDLELSQDIILKDILHKFTLINWDVNCHFEYYINNYKLSDNIEFNIITKFFINRILLIVEFNTKDLLIDNFFLNDENKHDKIKEYIKFIYDIKNNYSLITEAILPKYRNAGIASALINFAKTRYLPLRAEIYSSNQASINLHLKYGFKKVYSNDKFDEYELR